MTLALNQMFNFPVNLAIIKARHKIVLLLSVIILNYDCVCQDLEPETVNSNDVFILPAHTHVKDVSWRDSVYYFPDFQLGKITFHTGYSSNELIPLNYNLYLGQMTMIGYDGDTVQIPYSKKIKLATIGDHVFFHDNKIGFIEIIQEFPVALGVFRTMSIHTKYVQGTKDGTSYGSDVRGTPSAYARYYRKEERYYIIGKDNKVYKASASSILKLFNSKNEINAYLTENQPNFENKVDLLMLMEFCNEADLAAKN